MNASEQNATRLAAETPEGAGPVGRTKVDAQNPWPGLEAYDEDSSPFFYGRSTEAAELLRLIRLSPLTVVYGKSGLGKTSLLQAGLFHLLRLQHYHPVLLRLDFAEGTKNQPLEQVKQHFRESLDAKKVDYPPIESDESLWEYLHRKDAKFWSEDNYPLTPVLVFDQFEELFSRTGGNVEQIRQVFDGLADLIENRIPAELTSETKGPKRSRLDLLSQHYCIVLSFREDYLPEIKTWEKQVPSLLRSYLRLDPMSRDRAIETVIRSGKTVLEDGDALSIALKTMEQSSDQSVKPGARAIVEDSVAVSIVDLAGKRERQGDTSDMSDMVVEPVLLSVCCTQLNRRRADGARIDKKLVESVGQDILESFYRDALEDPEVKGTPDAADFIEEHLIQGDRFRGDYPKQGALDENKLRSEQLAALTDRLRLLRIVHRGDTPRIELIHDRLVAVVRASRDQRRLREQEREARRILRNRLLVWSPVVAIVLVVSFGLLFFVSFPNKVRPSFQSINQQVYLSEGRGWSGGSEAPLRQLFYYTPQGTSLKGLPYSWFVSLEASEGQTPFDAPDRMNSYGFLVDSAPTTANPDRLPVGFTSHYDASLGGPVLDITCAACHTGELVVSKNGKRYGLRIDGGAAMHAFTSLTPGNFPLDLQASLISTYLNPFKFNRFAHGVLGPTYPQGFWKLHGALRSQIWVFLQQAWNENKPLHPLYPTIEGVGRTDALARVGNAVFGDALSARDQVGNAPVRYPPLWDVWKFDYLQYNASMRQPMSRNLMESLGVGATVGLLNSFGGPIPEGERYDTTAKIENLHKIEVALWSLEPPKWSEDCFGKIDWDKAAEGQKLFAMTCAQCHGPFPASDTIKEWKAPLKAANNAKYMESAWDEFLANAYKHGGKEGPPTNAEAKSSYSDGDPFPLWVMHPLTVQDIGTDPTAALNFVYKQVDLRKFGIDQAAAGQWLRSQFQQDLRLEIKALANDIAAQTSGNSNLQDLSAAAADIAQQIYQDNSQAGQPLRPVEEAKLKLLSSKIRQRIQNDSSLFYNYNLSTDAIALDESVTSGQQQIDAAIESLDLSRANPGLMVCLFTYYMSTKYYKTMGFTPEQIGQFDGFGQVDLPVAFPQYKPRPLAGIWAVGPFLHNGSVPTIYQLLGPAESRDKKFWVGTRDFDSVNLGLSTRPLSKGGFLFDTSATGNSNSGHEFRSGYIPWKPGSPPQHGVIGPEFTEAQRWQIIEYLKVHRDTHTVKLSPDRKNIMEYLSEGLDKRQSCR